MATIRLSEEEIGSDLLGSIMNTTRNLFEKKGAGKTSQKLKILKAGRRSAPPYKQRKVTGLSSNDTDDDNEQSPRRTPANTSVFETPKSKSYAFVSMVIIVLSMAFFQVLGYWYLNMGSTTYNLRNNFLPCPEERGVVKELCVPKDKLEGMYNLVKESIDFISLKSGDFECGNVEKGRDISLQEFKGFLYSRRLIGEQRDQFGNHLQDLIFNLFLKNAHWAITLRDDEKNLTGDIEAVRFLSTERSQLTLWCRFMTSMRRVVLKLMLLSILSVLIIFIMGKVLMKKYEEETRDLVNLVEMIRDKLKEHANACQNQPELKPYLAIRHVHDCLVPLHDRKKMACIWEKAVRFISADESRVRTEMQTIAGEESAVWCWLLQSTMDSSHSTQVSQRKAFRSAILKLFNMVDVEDDESWDVLVEDAILEKCGPEVVIWQIIVERASKDGCIYVHCYNLASASKAFTALHGWCFNGKLVAVKYLHKQ